MEGIVPPLNLKVNSPDVRISSIENQKSKTSSLAFYGIPAGLGIANQSIRFIFDTEDRIATEHSDRRSTVDAVPRTFQRG